MYKLRMNVLASAGARIRELKMIVHWKQRSTVLRPHNSVKSDDSKQTPPIVQKPQSMSHYDFLRHRLQYVDVTRYDTLRSNNVLVHTADTKLKQCSELS